MMTEEGKELAVNEETPGVKVDVTTGGSVEALIPRSIDGFYRIAQFLAAGGLVPKAYEKNPNATISAMILGAEIGLTPFAAVQNIAVINGRPSIYGDALLALVRGSEKFDSIHEYFEGSGDDLTAVCELKRVGEIVTHVEEFSVADAKTAGLWGKQGPWKNYPKRMLKFRARGFALRDVFGDVLLGVVSREEADDMDVIDAEVVTPGKGDINEVVRKANAVVIETKENEKVDTKTGEITYDGPWVKANWVNMRAGDGVKSGLGKFVTDNLESFSDVPAELQEEVQKKWKKVYPQKEWPITGEEGNGLSESLDTSGESSSQTTDTTNQDHAAASSAGGSQNTTGEGESGSGPEEDTTDKLNELKEEVKAITSSSGISKWLTENGERCAKDLNSDHLDYFNMWVKERLQEVIEIEKADAQ
jgi:hypothetical protein